MEYETFKEAVLTRLTDDIPEPKKVSLHSVYKNNGTYLDGLAIMEDDANIAPTLYLNYYYEYYQGGNSFQATYEQILSHYESNKGSDRIEVGFFTDFERTRERIVFKLINCGKNRELLKDTPYIPFLDLAIVFYCMLPTDSDVGCATILIKKSHLELWKQTTHRICEISKKNSALLLAPHLRNINSLLEEIMPARHYPTVPVPEDPLCPMYVLTNSHNMFGAACLAYDGLIRSYAGQFHTDFYILPSSIHEVILVPTKKNDRMGEFSDMVRSVNETQVAKEDFLANHAYYYSYEQDQILF